MEQEDTEKHVEPTVLSTTDKDGYTAAAVAIGVTGSKRPAEDKTETDSAVGGEIVLSNEGRVAKKLRIDPMTSVIPSSDPPEVDSTPSPIILRVGDVKVPKIQDESRTKDDDIEEDGTKTTATHSKEEPPVLHRGASGDSVGRASMVSGANNADTPDDDDSDRERPLDLASMNAFEYERVVSSNPSALRRYEQYRRSDLKNTKVKRVLQALNPSLAKVNEPYVIAVKGLAKMFVGDVTEMAVRVRRERGEKGALQPAHLREAYRRLRACGVFPSLQERPLSFS